VKKKLFIATFVATQLFFIFFHIHKQSQFIKLSYEKQKYEKLAKELAQKKQSILQSLHIAQNRSAIKSYAEQELKMKKVRLDQVKTLHDKHKA
jgi:sortase (surface protein transpeptidase)